VSEKKKREKTSAQQLDEPSNEHTAFGKKVRKRMKRRERQSFVSMYTMNEFIKSWSVHQFLILQYPNHR